MDTTQLPPVKFDLSFTSQVDVYIERCKNENTLPSVAGYAMFIGTDTNSIWAWATKNKKDENGVATSELARPNFFAAVKKLEKIEKEGEPKEVKLNERQELFCQLYTSDREFFGNGVQTYIEVYEPDKSKPNWYNSARASASQLLSNINVCRRISELLEDGGLNDVNVDKQLQLLILQNADFSSKIAAIREYNKLRSRITEKIDHTTKGEKIDSVVGFNYLPPAKVDEPNNSNDQTNA